MDFIITGEGDIFEGVSSLVDIGGGTGTAARAIAKAFPHVKCSVLDLPNVINSISPDVDDGVINYIAGDMMKSIPPADVVFLKVRMLHSLFILLLLTLSTFISFQITLHIVHDHMQHVLHDWNDEDCVQILTQCKNAIHKGGKVIILDMVVGSPPLKHMLEAQLQLDLLMMAVTSGKERDEQQWRKIFMDAGFSNYKMRTVVGFTAITQLYP
jgi:hypothetical protein